MQQAQTNVGDPAARAAQSADPVNDTRNPQAQRNQHISIKKAGAEQSRAEAYPSDSAQSYGSAKAKTDRGAEAY